MKKKQFFSILFALCFEIVNIFLVPVSFADSDEDDDHYEYHENSHEEEEDDEDTYKYIKETSLPLPVVLTTPTPPSDTIAPQIQNVLPKDGTHFSFDTSMVTIEATVIDDIDTSPTVAGVGTYPLQMGLNIFTITATDSSGNISNVSIAVYKDDALPDTDLSLQEGSVELKKTSSLDTDNDGLTDFEEGIFKTDPENPDTDNDGMNDGDEVNQMRNPMGAGSIFSDIASSHYAASYILDFLKKGYISGLQKREFGVNTQMTRAEAVKLILQTKKIPLENSTSEIYRFSDIDTNDWFAAYIETALKNEIVKGFEDGTFLPNEPITRSEFTKILLVTYGISNNFEYLSPASIRFTDVDELSWQASYIEYAAENNILNGYQNGEFGINNPILRADAIKILSLALANIQDETIRKDIVFLSANERSLLFSRREDQRIALEKSLAAEAAEKARKEKILAEQKAKELAKIKAAEKIANDLLSRQKAEEAARLLAEQKAIADAQAKAAAAQKAAQDAAQKAVQKTTPIQTQTRAS